MVGEWHDVLTRESRRAGWLAVNSNHFIFHGVFDCRLSGRLVVFAHYQSENPSSPSEGDVGGYGAVHPIFTMTS
jgi:hypothetical protein